MFLLLIMPGAGPPSGPRRKVELMKEKKEIILSVDYSGYAHIRILDEYDIEDNYLPHPRYRRDFYSPSYKRLLALSENQDIEVITRYDERFERPLIVYRRRRDDAQRYWAESVRLRSAINALQAKNLELEQKIAVYAKVIKYIDEKIGDFMDGDR